MRILRNRTWDVACHFVFLESLPGGAGLRFTFLSLMPVVHRELKKRMTDRTVLIPLSLLASAAARYPRPP